MTVRKLYPATRVAVLVLVASTGLALSACSTSSMEGDSASREAAGVESPVASASSIASPSATAEPTSTPQRLGTRVCIVNDSVQTLPIKATEYDTLENPNSALAPSEQACASKATATVFRVYSPDSSLVTRLTAQSKSSGFVVNVLQNPGHSTGKLLESEYQV